MKMCVEIGAFQRLPLGEVTPYEEKAREAFRQRYGYSPL
jgi:hypothetical protein